ncbi:MAG: dihydropteroate synthase [Methylococcaceae bacterium]|jgi:dihydropteroate synthase
MSPDPWVPNAIRPKIMGILNLTPDSFSDGGFYSDPLSAVEHLRHMRSEGADVIDIGGESTRPGSLPVDPDEQWRRVEPVFKAVRMDEQLSTTPLSIDTSSSWVAQKAIGQGATLVNDVSAGQRDPDMLRVVADSAASLVLMHLQGTPLTMQQAPFYQDVVREVIAALLDRLDLALRRGIPKERLMIDPGIGFGKTRDHNLLLLHALPQFVDLGYPVLLGCSRKRFMGAIVHDDHPGELLGATVATTALGVQAGVHMFRVHDVKANHQAALVAYAIRQAV